MKAKRKFLLSTLTLSLAATLTMGVATLSASATTADPYPIIDTTSKENWEGTYGANGYVVVGASGIYSDMYADNDGKTLMKGSVNNAVYANTTATQTLEEDALISKWGSMCHLMTTTSETWKSIYAPNTTTNTGARFHDGRTGYRDATLWFDYDGADATLFTISFMDYNNKMSATANPMTVYLYKLDGYGTTTANYTTTWRNFSASQTVEDFFGSDYVTKKEVYGYKPCVTFKLEGQGRYEVVIVSSKMNTEGTDYESYASINGFFFDPVPVYSTITYELNGGENADANPTQYQEGKVTALAAATKAGYTFDGWYTTSDFQEGTKVTEISATETGELKLYAKFRENVLAQGTPTLDGTIDDVYFTSYKVENPTLIKVQNADPTEDCNLSYYAVNDKDKLYIAVQVTTAGNGWCNNETSLTNELWPFRLTDAVELRVKFQDDANEYQFFCDYQQKLNLNTTYGTPYAGGYEYVAKVVDDSSYIVEVAVPFTADNKGKSVQFTVQIDDCGADNKYVGAYTPQIGSLDGLASRIAANADSLKPYFVESPVVYENVTDATNPNPATYKEGIGFTLADATKTDYAFDGWYTTADFQENSKVTAISATETGSVTLYAKWLAVYDIIYVLDEGMNALANPATFTEGSAAVTLLDARKDGYTFDGWYTTDDFQESSKVTEIPANTSAELILYAKFTKIPEVYEISYELNGGVNASTNPATFTEGSAAVTLANATKDGYTFDGWYTTANFQDGTKVTEIAATTSADVTLYAKFTKIPEVYEISYVLNGGTNASTNPATFTEGSAAVTLAAATKDGYTFDGWYTTADFQAGTKVTEIAATTSADLTLYAKFTENVVTPPESSEPDSSEPDSSTPDSSAPATPSTSTEGEGGCFGTISGLGVVGATLALVSVAVACKKRKED